MKKIMCFLLIILLVPNIYLKSSTVKKALFPNTFITLVNKTYYLDKDYIPKNLVYINDKVKCVNLDIYLNETVFKKYQEMIQDLGLSDLYVFSGYRSYEKQVFLYNYYKDDFLSAKPGHSEHQTGLAIDVSLLDIGLIEDFKFTNEYQILINNAHKYGFILRYPENKTNITGYVYEPWHLRFVGEKIARFIYENNLTLEEFIYDNLRF